MTCARWIARCCSIDSFAPRFGYLPCSRLHQRPPMNSPATAARSRWPLHWKLAVGFLVGALAGLAVNLAGLGDAGWVTGLREYLTTPVSTVFLNLIFMLIVPLLFSALVVGIADMG